MFHRLLRRKQKPTNSIDKAKSTFVATVGTVLPVRKSPDESYGPLFDDVQIQKVFGDSKQFVDLVPRKRERILRRDYDLARQSTEFDLKDFIGSNFDESTIRKAPAYKPDNTTSAREHVSRLWDDLERRNLKNRGSLVALPNSYFVPGGRFEEQFYWDSYFIMLGLAADCRWSDIKGMMKNYSFMLRKFGLIPTANRTYFLSRSQPPFFASMVRLLASHQGLTRTYAEYLPSMLIEYSFWMKGSRSLKEHKGAQSLARVVRMPGGAVMNRYFDNKSTPRPDMPGQDVEVATSSRSHNKEKIFVDIRAAAESGWDFSSRWFDDAREIQTINTTNFVPVDLNCLLYQLERTIAEAYKLIKQPLLAKRYYDKAERRADMIRKYCWSQDDQFFSDYNISTGRASDRMTLAAVFPLFVKIATREQAEDVAVRLERDFLMAGGLVTTLEQTGQQWDSPNGWAPLQWVAIQGLREYGYHELADKIRDRWISTNEKIYISHRKMIEKYDVVNPDNLGGGGEYALQDGFGWTNGVYAALKDEQVKQHE